MVDHLDHLNTLLRHYEIPVQVNHLTHASPLLWLYLAEALLEIRLPLRASGSNTDGIIDRLRQKYSQVYAVLSILEQATGMELSYLGVEGIVGSDLNAIEGLVNVFWELHQVIMKDKSNDDIEGLSGIEFDEISLVSLDESEEEGVISSINQFTVSSARPFDNTSEGVSRLDTSARHRSIGGRNLRNSHSDTGSLVERDDITDFLHTLSRANTSRIQNESGLPAHSTMCSTSHLNREQPQPQSRRIVPEVDQSTFRVNSSNSADLPTTRVEKDLERVASLIESRTHQHIPSRIKSKIDTKQLSSWKRALDDRIYRKKIATHKLASSRLIRSKQEEYKQSEAATEKRLADLKKDKEESRRIVVSLNERVERVQRMSEVVQKRKKRDVDEDRKENAANGVYNDYLKKQRTDIMEKRRDAKEIEGDMRRKVKQHDESRQQYRNDQESMRKEESGAATLTREAVRYADEMDRKNAVREEKMSMRAIIKRVAMNKPEDIYLDQDIEKLKQSIQVDVRLPRKKQ